MRRDRARRIMRRLAPDDSKGYPEAHLWLVQDLVAKNLPLTPELRETMEHHLTLALNSERAAPEAHALLGQLLVERKAWGTTMLRRAQEVKQLVGRVDEGTIEWRKNQCPHGDLSRTTIKGN